MEVMKDLRIEEDEMLVSFDMSSLFMNRVPRQCGPFITGCGRTGHWVTEPCTLSLDRFAELQEVFHKRLRVKNL